MSSNALHKKQFRGGKQSIEMQSYLVCVAKSAHVANSSHSAKRLGSLEIPLVNF